MKLRRQHLLWLLVPITLLVLGWWQVKGKFDQRRHAWKDATLPLLVTTNEEVSAELDKLKSVVPDADRPWMNWVGEHVLLMTNGEYVVYATWHGFNSGIVDHLFLGRTSNGQWLYSTFHFCTRMVSVYSDTQPGSLSEFANTYSCRQFDGKSDECLRHTWP